MIDLEEMKYALNEAEMIFLQDSRYYNWHTYYLKVTYYYNIMMLDARYIEVKDAIERLLYSVKFLEQNIPTECYSPYHLEIDTLTRINHFLTSSLKEIKIPRKSIFNENI